MDHSTEVSYEGNCHCKAVCFSAKLPSSLSQLTVVSCNCSYCHISGSLHAFANNIEIHKGAESLMEYRFGSHTIQIFFCGICGANVYNKSLNPKFRYGQCAINIRLLQDINLETIEIRKGDGKSIHLPPLKENAI
ncbi:Mss4-like protein [Aspergillus californicus]